MQDCATAYSPYSKCRILLPEGQVPGQSCQPQDFPWPPKSPDLNPLDFYFWGVAEKYVCDERPKSLNQLKLIVENFARETLFKVADNFCTRAESRLQEAGGNFQHILKNTK